jgi:hypothetical protein
MVVTLVARNAKKGYGGIRQSLCLAGAWSVDSGGWFYVGAFGRNLASVTVKMFSHLI